MRDDRSNPSHQGGKLKYERPQLTRIGSLEDITRHAATGNATDASFGTGTPVHNLTFSDYPT